MTSETVLADLRRRAAIKLFDEQKKLSHDQVEVILEAARLSASSFGIQPWKVVVIEDDEMKKELRKHSYDQTQITTCSHLLVLCGLTDISDEYIDRYVDLSLQQGSEKERLESYRTMLKQSMAAKRADGTMKRYISNQVYIMLWNILHTCARLRIDAAPMEGFLPDKYDEVLGLDERGCHVCVICALGYRSENDTRSKKPKVRRRQEDIVIREGTNAELSAEQEADEADDLEEVARTARSSKEVLHRLKKQGRSVSSVPPHIRKYVQEVDLKGLALTRHPYACSGEEYI